MTLSEQIAFWIKGCERLAIMGIGNPLRGDDAVGLEILRELKGKLGGNVKLIECGMVPENYLAEIERFHPTHVLMIDAAQLEDEPGTARLIPPENIAGIALSTHAMPLSLMAGIIKESLGAKVILLGVQPEKTEFGEGLSPKLRKAARRIAEDVLKAAASIG